MVQQSERSIIEIDKVSKHYGAFRALNECSLLVQKGQKVVVCGPSGSGKSTLIRCINRLEEHDGGRIVVDGIELTSDMANVSPISRQFAMVFQKKHL